MSHARTLRIDLWQARAALVGILVLQWAVGGELHLTGRRLWLTSALELLLLASLTLTSERHVRSAQPAPAWGLRFAGGQGALVRVLALAMIALVSVINLAGLVRLVVALLATHGPQAQQLLGDALILFTTNVIISGLWYWELDRGGPYRRCSHAPPPADFLFPQMTLDAEQRAQNLPAHWRPRFVDYLFIAFTNATAFSPTDTLPLSAAAKLLMMLQAAVSLTTIAIVAARAVNILAQ